MNFLYFDENLPNVYDRKWVTEQLKQLRREGYVTEGFKLTVRTYLLVDEYYDAIARKNKLEAELLEKTAKAKAAVAARALEKPTAEALEKAYKEAEEEYQIAQEWYDYEEDEDELRIAAEYDCELTCDVLDSWYGAYCDADVDSNYNYQWQTRGVRLVISTYIPDDPSNLLRSLRKIL